MIHGKSKGVDDDYNMKALLAYELPVDRDIPMSQFEKLMINHMDTMQMTRRSIMIFLLQD